MNAPYPLCVGVFLGQERFFAAVLVIDVFPSLANRSAVRFLAAAMDAFFARAERCLGVMFWAAVLPPSAPYALPIFLRYSSTSGGIRFAMLQSYT